MSQTQFYFTILLLIKSEMAAAAILNFCLMAISVSLLHILAQNSKLMRRTTNFQLKNGIQVLEYLIALFCLSQFNVLADAVLLPQCTIQLNS